MGPEIFEKINKKIKKKQNESFLKTNTLNTDTHYKYSMYRYKKCRSKSVVYKNIKNEPIYTLA